MDFDLSDPFFTEYKPGEYKPLHDPHLKHFLNKKSVRRCLMKNNLITKDGEVRCTLQEFNRFQVKILNLGLRIDVNQFTDGRI